MTSLTSSYRGTRSGRLNRLCSAKLPVRFSVIGDFVRLAFSKRNRHLQLWQSNRDTTLSSSLIKSPYDDNNRRSVFYYYFIVFSPFNSLWFNSKLISFVFLISIRHNIRHVFFRFSFPTTWVNNMLFLSLHGINILTAILLIFVIPTAVIVPSLKKDPSSRTFYQFRYLLCHVDVFRSRDYYLLTKCS